MSVFQLLNSNKIVIWNPIQQYLLRVLVIFFLILSVPLDWKYYCDLASLDWSGFDYGIIFEASRYFPRFFSEVPVLPDVLLTLAFAGLLAGVWQKHENKSPDFDKIYYYLRILVRYRLAATLLTYGFIKLFPLQAPYPSLTLLNTPYGDLSAWKIFNLSIGVVPDYQVFLGMFEILAALLLLNRKTASTGAFISILFLGNVAMSNLAYEGGEFVYAGTLVLFALFVFAHDLPKYYSLLIKRAKTFPDTYKPAFTDLKFKSLIKSSFILLFVVIYGVLVFTSYTNGLTKYPSKPGADGLAGVYDVNFFVYEGDTIPYKEKHPAKWKRVIFENWATLSIHSDQPVTVDFTNKEYIAGNDQDKLYEAQGLQGWHFYEYEIEKGSNHFHLTNRNPNHEEDIFHFKLEVLDQGKIYIKGQDASGADFEALLIKGEKKYLLQEASKVGRRAKLIL